VWNNGTDMFTFTAFNSSVPSSVIKVNFETGFTVSPYTGATGSIDVALSWIDCVNNVHKRVYTIGTDGDPGGGAAPSVFIPTSPSR